MIRVTEKYYLALKTANDPTKHTTHTSAISPVWIIMVGHRLKSEQRGSMAAQTAPGQTYSRLPSFGRIVCNAHVF